MKIVSIAVEKHSVAIFGFVFMSNHFHLLLRLEGGGPQLSRFMKDVKSMSSRILYPERHGIWIPRFDDVAIFTEDQFRTKLNYIHMNLVKAGLVESAEEYAYSSAICWLTDERHSIIEVTQDW